MTDAPQTQTFEVAVIGAGPAGLTAAYELSRRSPDTNVAIFEASDQIGGISRTEVFGEGYRVDIGGHRFFTKLPEVRQVWQEILGDEFLRRARMSRIYYRGRFYDYPLKLFNALGNIGPYESARILASYFKWQVRPRRNEVSFEDWVINRFGGRLYMHFFRSYTEKVWGMNPQRIRADWAAQRIKSMTLASVVKKTLTGRSKDTSLIEEFDYPRHGPGQMWERCAEILTERGQKVLKRNWIKRLEMADGRVVAAISETPAGPMRIEADHFVNTMALKDLIRAIDPPPPAPVREAAERLRSRDFLIVALVLDEPEPFSDNWIYVHSEDVKVGRIQNFRAWSPDMVPNDRQSSIGLEYFCNEGEELWSMTDADLITLAARELDQLGLGSRDLVVQGHVIRQKKAYPVYDDSYAEALEVIGAWLATVPNLQTIGRNGLHRYNNQDHSMLTGLLAARNILGEAHDVWNVNVERSYHEEMEVSDKERSIAAAE